MSSRSRRERREDSSEERGRRRRRSRRSRSRSRSHSHSRQRSESPVQRRAKRRTAWDDPSATAAAGSTITVPLALPSTAGMPHLRQETLYSAEGSTQPVSLLSRIYVGNIQYGVTEAEIQYVFERCGTVKHIQMVRDPESCKSYCFIDFDTVKAAETALQTMDTYPLSGRPLRVGRPIGGAGAKFQPSTPAVLPMSIPTIDDKVARENNLPTLPGIKYGEPGDPKPPVNYPFKGSPKLYVGNLPPEISEEFIRTQFAPFGKIAALRLALLGTVPTVAFVEFEDEKSVEAAIKKMDKFKTLNRKLIVGRAMPAPAADAQTALAAHMSAVQSQVALGTNTGTSIQYEEDLVLVGGSARLHLMKKLLQSHDAKPPSVIKERVLLPKQPAQPLPKHLLATQILQETLAARSRPAPVTGPPTGQAVAAEVVEAPKPVVVQTVSEDPTRCIMLQNLVQSTSEVDDDLAEEVKAECSKYGRVEHMLIYDEAHPVTGEVEVKIFVLYAEVQGAINARSRLNNRFFAKRRIRCSFFNEDTFRRLME
eukprot:TRINITY_DN1435_c0_g1_i2.p1 TRINITY_DN1435_c0_g1~~TRINITY_DN1435_c0_g1_i2.p1  ORF type:complete len:537 (+),score=77.20 TRINITY_DN1435_c0_g1_i2:2639-4249(+)